VLICAGSEYECLLMCVWQPRSMCVAVCVVANMNVSYCVYCSQHQCVLQYVAVRCSVLQCAWQKI